jgi:hypothetical protein
VDTGVAFVALWIAGGYLAVGAIVAVAFVASGIGRVDVAARGAPWTFRLLVVPGAIALWPVVLRLWWRS